MRDGLLRRCRGCWRRCDPSLTSLQALGYKELIAHLQGACTLAQAVEKIKQRTRNFAKRQLTWFRREKGHRLDRAHRRPAPRRAGRLAEQALRQRGKTSPQRKDRVLTK